MREVTVKLYQFNELSDEAKAKARAWFMKGFEFQADFVLDDALEIGRMIGFEFNENVGYKGILYSGFGSQGDGACIVGTYQYKAGCVAAVKQHAPKDTKLHGIVERIQHAQMLNGYRIALRLTHNNNYYHDRSVTIADQSELRHTGKAEGFVEEVREELRAFMRWIYVRLSESYDWQTSDEAVDENIIANEYEFDANGRRTVHEE